MKLPSRPRLIRAACILSVSFCHPAFSDAPPAMPPPAVEVVSVQAETIPITLERVGRLAATRIAQVRARVAGIVLERTYTEGADVKRGQVLFRIDPAPLQAALHAEQAALDKAQADAINAAVIARRYGELADKHLIAKQDLDTAQATARSSAAAVKQAQANVEKDQLNLGYATVTAPIAGRAGRALVTEGALVGQGEATELTSIEQIDPLYLNFSQSVADLEQMQRTVGHQKTRVTVLLQDGSPYPHPGALDFADAAVDPATNTLSLRALVPNPDHRLLPGMFVHLTVTVGQREHAFRLPQAALARDAKGAYVLVVDATGKVKEQRVSVHEMTLRDWIVSGDLANSAQVIVAGLQKAKPGASVKAVPWTKASAQSPAQHP